MTLPITEYQPSAGLFFMLVFISLNMTILNVIMASVVDAVSKARTAHDDLVVEEKQKELASARKNLERLCRKLDKDGGGTLTYDELREGFINNPEFRLNLEAMDVKLEDLYTVFHMLDTDSSGDLNHKEFCDGVFKMKTSDEHTMLVFIKHHVQELFKDVHETIHILKSDILNSINDGNSKLSEVLTGQKEELKNLETLERTAIASIDRTESKLDSREPIPRSDWRTKPGATAQVTSRQTSPQVESKAKAPYGMDRKYEAPGSDSADSMKAQDKIEIDLETLSSMMTSFVRELAVSSSQRKDKDVDNERPLLAFGGFRNEEAKYSSSSDALQAVSQANVSVSVPDPRACPLQHPLQQELQLLGSQQSSLGSSLVRCVVML
jgi:hypothetical protein